MATIQIQISEDVIQAYGVEAIRDRLQAFVELEKLRLLAQEIHQEVTKAGHDNDQLWEEARQQAWNDFKKQQLKDILP